MLYMLSKIVVVGTPLGLMIYFHGVLVLEWYQTKTSSRAQGLTYIQLKKSGWFLL